MRIGIVIGFCALSAAPAFCQDQSRPIATKVTWQSVWQAEAPVRVPIADEPARERLELPALAKPEGTVLCLRFKARLHTERPAGWNNYLGLILNGTPLARASDDGWPRVLNRELIFATTHANYPEVDLIQTRGGLPCLQVFFGPPEPDLGDTVLTDVEEGYWYLLTIDDVGLTDRANELAIVNTALREYWGDNPPAGADLVVEELSIGCVPQGELADLRGKRYVTRERLDGPALTGPGAVVRVLPGGGLQIEMDDETWFVESAFSFPRDPKMGLNRLLCLPEADGEKNWKPSTSADDDRLAVRATGSQYRLEREARWQGSRIVIEDTVTNLTDEVLGLAVQHAVVSPEPPRRMAARTGTASAEPLGTRPASACRRASC